MLQYKILKWSPWFLRWYRVRFLVDLEHIRSYLPIEGRILDVGCGVGMLDHAIARANSKLNFLGIDIAPQSIDLANEFHALPNVEYSCQRLETVNGQFDCVLFVDVFHHVSPAEYTSLLESARALLAPGGYVLIKDIERRRGHASIWMDRYVSGCRELYMHNCDELAAYVSRYLTVEEQEVKFRLPFPHYYIKARAPGNLRGV